MTFTNINLFKVIFTIGFIQIIQTSTNEYCRSLDLNGNCTYCALTYLDQNLQCVEPSNKIDNCLSYQLLDDKLLCKLCHYNYQLNSGFDKCEKISIDNCLLAADQDCLICDKNIQVNNGQCNKDDLIHIPNCLLSTGSLDDPWCTKCDDEFILFKEDINETMCMQVTQNTQNCDLLLNEKECQVCQFNYYMNEERICVKSSKYSIDLFEHTFKILIGVFTMILFY